MSLREQILNCDDLQRQAVEVPEWGCTVHVRSLSAKQVLSLSSMDDGVESTAKTVVMVAVDEQGVPLFTEADIPALVNKSFAALNRIMQAVRDMLKPLNDLGDLEKK